MKIKGHTFLENKPVICIPVVEKTKKAILEAIKEAVIQQAEMIEWRMDWYEEVQDLQAVKGLLDEMQPLVENTVLLCTFRSKAQGGEREITSEAYGTLNRTVAESQVPDLVDLEFYESKQPREAIEALKTNGVGVVCSHHNFKETPSIAEMEKMLEEMVMAGGTFAKLAVMPQKKTDVLHLMEAVLKVKEKHPQSHLVAMSMGQEGMVSRILGGWYQSEITFAALKKSSAPGQMAYQDVAELLTKLERC